MKRWILLVLALCLMLVLTGCKCKHEETTVVGAVDATCTEAGYTGDVTCVKCNEIVTPGTEVAPNGHVEGEPQGARESNCVVMGYTGDVYCTVCDELVTAGEDIPKAEHTPGERNPVREATCYEEGFTGNVACSICYERIEDGETVEMLPHPLGELENVVEVTCLQDGYTGDAACTACSYVEKGEVLPKLDHAYENGVCTMCGWREPGLYIDGVKQFTWEQMIENSYVEIKTKNETNTLASVAPSLYGELIVGENIHVLGNGSFVGTGLSLVWLPSSCTAWRSGAFHDSAALEEVRFFGEGTEIGSEMFKNCTALKTVIMPDSVVAIRHESFRGCTALESIDLPDSLVKIENNMFRGCTALKEVLIPESVIAIADWVFEGCASLETVIIPDSVESIGLVTFQNSGVRELVMPAGLTELDGQYEHPELVKVDLSKCTLMTNLDKRLFSDSPALEEIILPASVQSMSVNSLQGCSSLKRLALPDAFKEFKNYGISSAMETMTSVTEVVWPVSLTDGTALTYLPNLTSILYRGSELQWSLTASKDMFPNAVITYNYTGE